ncbi:MAG: hypothetical protein NVS4B13_04060 [Candidatus Elarobacter sp.]
MRSSAENAGDAVGRTIVALERACLDAESAFEEERPGDVDAALRTQDELTGELALLFAAAPEFAPASDPRVAQRVEAILAYRDGQLRRLEARRDEIAARLSAIGKVNAFSRSFRARGEAAHLLDGQY